VVADGETGFLVPPRDHHAMAEQLVRLLKDEALRARMGEAALRRARERFTVERMVEATAAVYDRLTTDRSQVEGQGSRVKGQPLTFVL
jgi:glycosyltransferase involved in cell wall biosynthesis